MEELERLQKAIMGIFQEEIQALDPELQSTLIDDLITTFNNRLNILKKIQHSKEMQLGRDDSFIDEPFEIFDPDTLQSMDESSKEWVKEWRKAVAKLV